MPAEPVGRRSRRSVDHVAVVVPARDEAASIGRALDSIDVALACLPARMSGSCVIVLDDCTDHTALVIAERSPREPWQPPTVVVTDVGCAGAAREVGTRTALSAIDHPLHRIWIASTDADTAVPPDWLVRQVHLAERGADAVAGIVELDADADERLRIAFGASYELGRDGSHRHVHGANLGVRADRYLEVGGWRALRTGEDHDLWARLGAVGNCVSSTSVVVRTSGRLAGRAPLGFAADMAMIAGGAISDEAASIATMTELGRTVA